MDEVERLAFVIAELVGFVQPVERVDQDPQHDARWETPVAAGSFAQLLERGAVDVFHHQEESVLGLLHVDGGHDVGVTNPRCEPRLVEEHRDELLLRRDVRVHHLHGDEALEATHAHGAREVHHCPRGGGGGGAGGAGGEGGAVAMACGDGFVDAGEQCDDGGTASGDGCSAECAVECDGLFDEATFHCYVLLSEELAVWADGRTICQGLGAGFDLVAISSEEEQAFLVAQPVITEHLVPDTNAAVTLLGGTDAEVEGEWVWSNGEPFFPQWVTGEPSNDGIEGEDCTVYLNRDGLIGYDDRPCDNPYPVFCELTPAGRG